MGELGWMTMRGRHMLLRLSSCSKILAMEDGRWVKKVYEHGRRRLEKGGRANTWCNLTRKWLRDLGLEEEWKQQAGGPAWQERLKAMIMEYEARTWRRWAMRKDDVKVKDCTASGRPSPSWSGTCNTRMCTSDGCGRS